VVVMNINSPDSLANGEIGDDSPGVLADVTLDASSDSVSQVFSTVKSANNAGSPATSDLELSVDRQGSVIQAAVMTVMSGPGLQKDQLHISAHFMNGSDPQFITHGFVSRDAGISEMIETKESRFFGLSEKTITQSEEMKFSDAAFFDPLAGVDLQCALVK
jgi:hypothetical protein